MGSARGLVDSRRNAITAALQRHHGLSIAIFGSVARGEDTDGSDIDFLVDFEPGSSLFDLLHLQDELSYILGRAVDVVSSGGLKDRDIHIRNEAVRL